MNELHDSLIEKLTLEIASSQEAFLKPLSHLCRKFCVSFPTLLNAAHTLRRQGVIDFQKGSKILICGRSPSEATPRLPAVSQLLDLLMSRIASGYYRVGIELPKLRWLAEAEHVSTHTASAAYRELIRRKIAYQSGRSVILGKQPAGSSATPFNPVIVVLAGEDRGWRNVCFDINTEQFGHAFMGEAALRGVRLSYACTVKPNFPNRLVPSGPMSVKKHIRRLGFSYAGTLIVGSLARIPDVAEWIHDLSRFEKPIVYFDRNDELDISGIASPHFLRCRVSEERVASVALAFLARHGHRTIGFPDAHGSTWHQRRVDTLRAIAVRDYSGMQIIDLPEHESERWRNPSLIHFDLAAARDSGLHGIREAIGQLVEKRDSLIAGDQSDLPPGLITGSPFDGIVAGSYRRIFIGKNENSPIDSDLGVVWKALSAIAMLSNRNVTAIIIQNDAAARTVLETFETLGIRIPERISLISFDNRFRYTSYPLTSVDFGLQRLGYKAFHGIADDIPVRSGKDPSIAAEPYIADNGSVLDLT